MNKKLITLAVAAALVAPLAVAAETTLYGRIDTAVTWADDDTNDAWDLDTGTTRIGVKGSEDLGNGLKAIFQAEWEFTSTEGGSTASGDLNFDNRLSYAGLSGGFGTVTLGRQWTPYYGAVNKSDIFNNPGGSNSADPVGNVVGANNNSLGPSRTGNAVIYASPNFSGFQGKVALIMDRGIGLGGSDNIDAYNPSLTYDNGPISVGLSGLFFDDDAGGLTATKTEQDVWGIGASYNFGMFKLIAQYEDKDESDAYLNGKSGSGNDDGADEWTLVGEATFGNNILRAQYANVDYDNGYVNSDKVSIDDMDVWVLGLQHNFSNRTRVYAEYTVNDMNANKGFDDQDKDAFALGLRHDF